MKREEAPPSDGLRQEIELHKRLAGEYERRRATAGSRHFEAFWNDEVLRALAPFRKEAALDCCCGDGILLPTLLTAFARVTGIDISAEMLNLARHRAGAERCTILQGNMESLPFEAGSFDAAVFRGAFHHLAKPQESLCEVARVLRPGGGVVFFEPNGDPLLLRSFRRLYYALSSGFSSTHRCYRRRELFDLIGGAGLQPVTAYTIFFLSYPFAGLLDHFPFLRFIPFHAHLTRLLIRLDRALTGVPLIRHWGLCLVVVARKGEAQG